MLLNKILYIIILLIPLAIQAQPGLPKPMADSLWQIWNDPEEADTSKLKAMEFIAWDGFLFSKPDSALHYSQKIYDLAKKRQLKSYMANARNTQGVACHIKGEHARALQFYKESYDLRKELGSKKGITGTLSNMALLYATEGNIAKAIESYTNCLKAYEQLGDKKGMATTYNNMGLLYGDQSEYEQAINYHHKSLQIRQDIADKEDISASLNNLGLIYIKTGDYEKAIEYFEKSLKINRSIKNERGIAFSQNNIGLVYLELKDYQKALTYIQESLKIKEASGEKEAISRAYLSLADVYEGLKQYTKATNYGEKAYRLAKETGSLAEIKQSAYALYKSYKATGHYKKAMEMHEVYLQTRDSLESEKNQKELIRQKYKYEYEKQATADSIKAMEAKKVVEAQLAAQQAETQQHILRQKHLETERKKQKQQSVFLIILLSLALVFGILIFKRFKISQKQRKIIHAQKQKVDEAYDELEEKNQEIIDSINYAKRIQKAILPPETVVRDLLGEHFILYIPKDIVAGDFYWVEPFSMISGSNLTNSEDVLFAVCDCTGHGVPGAMVSVICNNGLNRAIREYGLRDPGEILDKTREIVIKEFEKSEEEVKDGMDIALCSLKVMPGESQYEIKYAGAHNPLWIIRDKSKEVEQIRADKQPIGKFDMAKPFTTHTIKLQKGDAIYLFSDGFADQFGGNKGKKFKTANFKYLLLSIQDKPMHEQKQLIYNSFANWMGDIEQLDDVCVIGVKL